MLLLSENGLHCALTHNVFPTSGFQVNPDKNTEIGTDLTDHQSLREDKVRDEIARRLSCVCGNFSEREFRELVSKMAERQLLDERRQRW